MKPLDLEGLKELFMDDKEWALIGVITALELAKDKSVLRVKLKVLDEENREIVARMSWENVGSNSGFYEFPDPGDLVLVRLPGGDEDKATVIKRYSSVQDKIPDEAVAGDTVLKSKFGKKLHLMSDTRINLASLEALALSALVLGDKLMAHLTAQNTAISTHTHPVQPPVPPAVIPVTTLPPHQAAIFTGFITSPIGDGTLISKRTFTE